MKDIPWDDLMTPLHNEIERRIGELTKECDVHDVGWLALANRCSQIIKGFEERLTQPEDVSLTPLERYALMVLDAHREDIGDLDGAFLQDKAEECGLLYYVDVTEPCGDYCRCAEYDDFPQQCLRLKPEFEPKMAQLRRPQKDES